MPVLPAFRVLLQYFVKVHFFLEFEWREFYAQRLNGPVLQRELGVGIVVYTYGNLFPLPAEIFGYFFLQLYHVQKEFFGNVDFPGNEARYIGPYRFNGLVDYDILAAFSELEFRHAFLAVNARDPFNAPEIRPVRVAYLKLYRAIIFLFYLALDAVKHALCYLPSRELFQHLARNFYRRHQ